MVPFLNDWAIESLLLDRKSGTSPVSWGWASHHVTHMVVHDARLNMDHAKSQMAISTASANEWLALCSPYCKSLSDQLISRLILNAEASLHLIMMYLHPSEPSNPGILATSATSCVETRRWNRYPTNCPRDQHLLMKQALHHLLQDLMAGPLMCMFCPRAIAIIDCHASCT